MISHSFFGQRSPNLYTITCLNSNPLAEIALKIFQGNFLGSFVSIKFLKISSFFTKSPSSPSSQGIRIIIFLRYCLRCLIAKLLLIINFLQKILLALRDCWGLISAKSNNILRHS